jgi:hypothetical protein
MTMTTLNSRLVEECGRDWIKGFMKSFAPFIKLERATSRVASALFIDALAGVLALAIAGRQDSEQQIVDAAIASLRVAVKRDLRHLQELGHK